MEAKIEYENNLILFSNFELDEYHKVCFDVKVMSSGFCGLAWFEVNKRRFRKFVRKMRSMNRLTKLEVLLVEEDQGSVVEFCLDRLGHLTISGNLYDPGFFQSLKFEFCADQTVLGEFCDALKTVCKELKNV